MSDDATPPPLHELETEIMDVAWSREETTVRDVLDELNARSERVRAYTTVMTVMTRLCDKGLLERRRRGKTDVYHAALDREEYDERRSAGQVAELLDTYGDRALVHFARSLQKLDPDRRERLRRLARRTKD